MSYKLQFLKPALKEWKKLDNTVKEQFKKKLEQRLQNPRVESDRLHGFKNIYKIKLRAVGYRLAYEVKDEEIVIIVLKIGKRDKVYNELKNILK